MSISIPLMITAPRPCSYLSEQQAQSAFVETFFPHDIRLYSELISHGFRRSGDNIYRPHCETCHECVPVRLAVNDFQANRQQKRCLQKNQNTTAKMKPAVFDEAHYAMYLRYQQQRHGDGQMQNSSREDYLRFLSSRWCTTQFVEFSVADTLMAIAVVDRVKEGLSAVYTFFEPQFSHYSPGTYAVLWQIEQARHWELDYLYLGFWIADCQKMNYKNQYRPLQGLRDGQWEVLDTILVDNKK